MIYSIPYIILIAFLGLFAFLYENITDETIRKRLIVISIIIFFVFFGFRGFILSDWIIYYQFFYNCTIDDVLSFQIDSSYFEPGFTLLTLLCKSIFNNYHFFVFIITLIDTLLLLRFFRKRVDNIPLALMIYIVFEGLVISTNLMRNSIAILLFINALQYLEERKPLQYFAICLLALSFHTSSIVYFPLYFFFHKSCNKWGYLSIFILCNIIFICHFSIVVHIITLLGFDEVFTQRVKVYTELYDSASIISIGYIERLFTGFLVFFYYNKLKEIRKDNAVFINGIIAYFIMFFVLSEFQVMSKRFATLFAYGYWIIWIDLIKCFAYENNKRLFQAFIFIYCLLRIAGSTYLPDFDYDNVLFGIKSYQERLYIHNRTYEGP